jgi:hypothetical protein
MSKFPSLLKSAPATDCGPEADIGKLVEALKLPLGQLFSASGKGWLVSKVFWVDAAKFLSKEKLPR